MSQFKPKLPGEVKLCDPGCLDTQDITAVCLRLQSHRQRIALPYALLLRSELSADETTCVVVFATHEVTVRGRQLLGVYLAVSQGQAKQISIGDSAVFVECDKVLGPLVTEIRIEPIDDLGRSRR